MFWLEQAIIRPLTRTLRRKIKTASRFEISQLLAVLLFLEV
jgi:hypothetical protein